jgi:hypothetical protein
LARFTASACDESLVLDDEDVGGDLVRQLLARLLDEARQRPVVDVQDGGDVRFRKGLQGQQKERLAG